MRKIDSKNGRADLLLFTDGINDGDFVLAVASAMQLCPANLGRASATEDSAITFTGTEKFCTKGNIKFFQQITGIY